MLRDGHGVINLATILQGARAGRFVNDPGRRQPITEISGISWVCAIDGPAKYTAIFHLGNSWETCAA
jgi:hypothetical protein